MLSLFMRPGSVLFEVYPHKYYKAGYAPMAASFGLRYAYSQSQSQLPLTRFSSPSTETCMRWYFCRWYARRANVRLSDQHLEVLISLMLDSERSR